MKKLLAGVVMVGLVAGLSGIMLAEEGAAKAEKAPKAAKGEKAAPKAKTVKGVLSEKAADAAKDVVAILTVKTKDAEKKLNVTTQNADLATKIAELAKKAAAVEAKGTLNADETGVEVTACDEAVAKAKGEGKKGGGKKADAGEAKAE